MAKVYVSSTIADLKPERQAVLDWLRAARHQAVDSYLPNSETVRDSCLEDVDGCDLYVLILGHRYGFQPPDDNSEQLSITQLEFRRAGQRRHPVVGAPRRFWHHLVVSPELSRFPHRHFQVRGTAYRHLFGHGCMLGVNALRGEPCARITLGH